MSCEEKNDKGDCIRFSTGGFTMTEESTSPCIFKFKVDPKDMKWKKMYSNRIKIDVKLLSKKTADCG